MNVSRLSRRIASAAATVSVAATALVASPAAAEKASDEGTLTLPVTGAVALARPAAGFPLPTGARLVGTLNPDFTVAGDLLVPETAVPVRLLGLPRFGDTTATVRFVGTAPTQTTFAEDGTVSVTHTFRLEVPQLDADDLPDDELVKETCRSGEITATLHADSFDLFEPFPLDGTFTVPPFRGCGGSVFGLPGVRDLLMTELLSGPDNVLSVTVGPVS